MPAPPTSLYPDAEHGGPVYYHIAEASQLRRILRQGLQPQLGYRSQTIESDPSVYLFTSYLNAENALHNWLGEEFDEATELILLQITLPPEIPVFHHPEVGWESWVEQVIPPSAIKALPEIQL
jgi:hypothetical protein